MNEDDLRKLIFRAHSWMQQLKGGQAPDAELLRAMGEVAAEYERDHGVKPK